MLYCITEYTTLTLTNIQISAAKLRHMLDLSNAEKENALIRLASREKEVQILQWTLHMCALSDGDGRSRRPSVVSSSVRHGSSHRSTTSSSITAAT